MTPALGVRIKCYKPRFQEIIQKFILSMANGTSPDNRGSHLGYALVRKKKIRHDEIPKKIFLIIYFLF